MILEGVIGIDAGGTGTRLLLLDPATGATVGEAQGDAADDGHPVLEAPLRAALTREACSSVRAVCAGITKITRGGVRAAWEAELRRQFPTARIEVVPDYVIAFHGATGGIGVAVIAGTGSVVYGEDGRGGTVRVGGRGWEYGDEGSGAWLTTEIVRRTLRSLDHIDAPTPLTEAVCRHLGTGDPAALAERARQRAAEAGRGFLVPLALEQARSGDGEAAHLFTGAAAWLAAQARAAAGQLSFGAEGCPVIATVGGLWEAGDLLREPFRQLVHRWLPSVEIAAPRAAPVAGAARRAAALLSR